MISDTHAQHRRVDIPDGDVLVHAGDITRRGGLDDLADFNAWLGTLPHRHKVVIAGNHDWCFVNSRFEARGCLTNATYLQDEATEIDGVRFWGSPWQPWFLDWAFNLARGVALQEVWAKIPIDTDVLITHGPPLGILDMTTRGEPVGCEDLLARIDIVQPALHVFGHIHEGGGMKAHGRTTFVNASTLDERYQIAHPVRVVDLIDGVVHTT